MRTLLALLLAILPACDERERDDAAGVGIVIDGPGYTCEEIVSEVRETCGSERYQCFRLPKDANGQPSLQCAHARACTLDVLPSISDACDLLDSECVDAFAEEQSAWEDALAEEHGSCP